MTTHRYYSQNGEDAVLWALFDNQSAPGFFVDVGALDGRRFSNTYSFELAGWNGVCVEAHPDYIDLLQENRPKSICIHAAVSDRDADKVDFYAHDRGRSRRSIARRRSGSGGISRRTSPDSRSSVSRCVRWTPS